MRHLFLIQAFKNFRRTGALLPSSRVLTRVMARPFGKMENPFLVELGAGTGSVTKALLKYLPKRSKLLAFEINPVFCKNLRKKLQDPRLQILEGCATKISRSVNGKVDGVVSALPLLNFSQQKKVKILNEVEKVLAPGGVFVQFSYGFFRPWLDLKKHFRKIKVNFVLLNFPPAFVFVCQK